MSWGEKDNPEEMKEAVTENRDGQIREEEMVPGIKGKRVNK